MARFRFRLQAVLSYKEQVAEVRQQALAVAQARRAAVEARLRATRAQRAEQAAALHGLMRPGTALDLAALEQGQRHLDALDDAIAACEAELEICRQVEEEERQRAIAALQEQKSLERLRDRQAARAQSAQARAETKQSDEAGLLRFHQHRGRTSLP
jgi:flagellar export protein FliJ